MNPLGTRIRWIRGSQRMTLKQLSRSTALTISFLSQVERGAVLPSVDSLRKIAHSLGVPVGQLFDEGLAADKPLTLLRKSELKQDHVRSKAPIVEALAGGLLHTRIEPRLITLRPKMIYRPDLRDQGCEAFGMVWQGQVELAWEPGETIALSSGDSIYVQPRGAYRITSTGTGEASILWITFSAER